VSAAPVSIDGLKLGAVMEFVDITEIHYLQEQLADERNFMNAVLQTSGALIVVIDKNGGIVRFNRACEQLSGYTSEDVMGHSVFDFIPVDELEGVRNVTARLFAGEISNEYENHWLNRSGEKHFIRWRNSVLSDENGQVEFVIATGIDISDRKKLEEELNIRAHDLAVSNHELESFSYSISHDLRGPLSIIGGFASILLDDYADKLDFDAQDYLHRMDNSVKKMKVLIESLLSLSRISRQEVKREDVNLSALVNSYLRDLQSVNPQRRVNFIIHPDVHVNADPKLLMIALENLLRNAWKFTSKRDETCIEFGKTEYDGKQVFFIRDNGAGFDMKFAEKIFEPFKRIHSEKEFGGTGVGLSIVQRVIDRHGGKVWAEGETDKGATFYFTLR
jgi:PAS domain S-box-containing protein